MNSKLLAHLGLSLPFDSQHKLVTSPFFSPTVLASIRLIIAFYSLFTLVFVLIWEAVVLHDASGSVLSSFLLHTIISAEALQLFFLLYGTDLDRSLCLLLGFRGAVGSVYQTQPQVVPAATLAKIFAIPACFPTFYHHNIS